MSTAYDDRTFHATDSGYSLPNDSAEHSRLESQARGLNTLIGERPFVTDLAAHARGKPTFTAIDVGCGTGINTVNMARMLLSSETAGDAKVYGIDLSPVPAIHEKPANVEWVQGNIMELAGQDPRFPSASIDFATSRLLVMGMSDWPGYAHTCFTVLKPGGRVEMQEGALRWVRSTGENLSEEWKWWHVFRRAAARVNIDILAPMKLKEVLIAEGFVDVKEERYQWPWSSEPVDGYPEGENIRRITKTSFIPLFEVIVRRLVQKAGLHTEEDLEGFDGLDAVIEDVRRTLSDSLLLKGVHFIFYVVTGKRP